MSQWREFREACADSFHQCLTGDTTEHVLISAKKVTLVQNSGIDFCWGAAMNHFMDNCIVSVMTPIPPFTPSEKLNGRR